MCSIAPPDAGRVTVAAYAAAVAHVAELLDGLAAAVADPERLDLGGVPADVAAALTTSLLRIADRGTAVATVLAGHVTATSGPGTGTLIAGRYASPRRWLESDAGLAASSAKAVLARARDLREHSGPVQQAWLAGGVSGDAARQLTSGVSGVLATVSATREEKDRLRADALDLLLPVAHRGTVGDLARAVQRMRLLAESAPDDPEREAARAQAAIEAYDDQRLTCVQVGDHSIISATLTHESAAAAMTAIDQYARRIADRDRDVVHDPACPLAVPPPHGSTVRCWCTCGASAAAGVVSRGDVPHLRAVAFGELMAGQLDDGRVGSHHGVAPHVTVTVDVDRLAASLGGELGIPGSDEPVLIGSHVVRRILCDAAVTPVVVRRASGRSHDCGGSDLPDLLVERAVEVLYVGRTDRTVPPRLRRALEVRDRHCVFPGCRAHPRRCHAHHVLEWENGGATDIDNCALLCVRHHISVHEGGWTITRTPDVSAHATGCWTFTPPRPQP